MNGWTRMQHRFSRIRRLIDGQSGDHAVMSDERTEAAMRGRTGSMQVSGVVATGARRAESAVMEKVAALHAAESGAALETVESTSAGAQETARRELALDYDALAEAAAQRPVVVYVDKKAAAVLMTREMDTAIGNRNIQQLMSMGG